MRSVPVTLLPRRLRYGLAVGVASAVFLASVVDPPATGAPSTFLGLPADKWLHAVAYAALAGAVGYAALGTGRLSPRELFVVFCLAAGYGFAVELVQAPLPARAFDPTDAVANAVGAAAGTAPFRRLRGRNPTPLSGRAGNEG